MSLGLRTGLSWCICARQAVFLDLRNDRYFCLPGTLDSLFQHWIAGNAITCEEQAMLVGCGVAEIGGAGRMTPALYPAPERDHASGNPPPAILDILAAAVGQLRARRRLRRRPLAGILAQIGTAEVRPDANDETVQRRIAGAFAASATLLRAADQCLPRAIAARHICHLKGQNAALIFGVRLHPFAAHSWVQSGGGVVVGGFEQARLFTPILVVP